MPPDRDARQDPPRRPHLLVGLDFGKKHDYTAIAVIERQVQERPRYTVRVLDRVRQVSYTDIADLVAARLRRPPLRGATLVIDETGVGTGPGDMLARKRLRPWRVTITGGSRVASDGRNLTVPKRDLVLTVDLLLEQGRLKTAPGLALGPTLMAEMEHFQYRVTPSGTMIFGAANDPLDWRDAEHDDLVLAVALAIWFGEKAPRPVRGYVRQARVKGWGG